VRAAAIGVLSKFEAKDRIALVRSLVAEASHAEAVSTAAMRFLSKYGDASDLPALQARASLGWPDRSRPDAMDAIAEAGCCSFEPREGLGGEVIAERVAVEDDDVDVGVRKDFAPAVAANSDELEVGEPLGTQDVRGGA
jgi:hypothetical protein